MPTFERGTVVRVPFPYTDRPSPPAPSLVRPSKIATIDSAQAEPLGKVGKATLMQIDTALREQLEL